MKPERFARRISDDLRALGLQPGGLLLVHSSLGSMGRVPGGPETVIRGLLTALGPDGTLLLPALTYEFVTLKNPVFDSRTTPCCVGAIPEHFRTREGTLRSVHPTHSVCGLGPLAADLLDRHKSDTTPCGPSSPFRLLPEFDGQILMLGCGLRPNTSMHSLEETVVPEYLFDPAITYTISDESGTTIRKDYTPHGFHGWEQRYDRIGALMDPDALRTGQVAGAESHLLDAREFWRIATARLRADPLFFVDRARV
jgi:aminoglycoside 3-N-acetyltransferase